MALTPMYVSHAFPKLWIHQQGESCERILKRRKMEMNIEDLRLTSLPLSGTCSGVYFLFQGNELVYVGQGWNCLLRVAEHTRKESCKKFSSWNFIPVPDEHERKTLEQYFQSRLKTKYDRNPKCMIFKIDNDHNIVSCVRAVWDLFPAPYTKFRIQVQNKEYITSKRNLESKCTSFGKIYDSGGKRITHTDFCVRHALRIKDGFQVTEITPLQTYRLEI